MITRPLAAVAAVVLLLTLLINGPFGIDEGTYRKIYGALPGLAPKAAPARDAQQQNNLPDIEAMAACLIGQAAVSLHGQRSTDHDAEKAAEIALRQAMIVCRHGLALLWQILSSTGFPNHFFCDSWVVGFWRGRLWLAGYRIGKASLDVGSSRFWISWATRRGDKCARSTCQD